MGAEIGLFGLLVIALDIYAIIRILGSTASNGSKILWFIMILVLPVVGLILWVLFGPSGRAGARS
jgi:hypothetical protein